MADRSHRGTEPESRQAVSEDVTSRGAKPHYSISIRGSSLILFVY
ncbi:hypothetical protein LCGC14_3107710, partial [marine sediment metagenome]